MNRTATDDSPPGLESEICHKLDVSRFWIIFLSLGSLTALYFQLYIFPSVPLLAQGDQSIYLLNGRRLLQGQIIYRDFFYFTFPGTDATYGLLFKLFGVRAWIPNAMLVLLGVGLVGLSIAVSRKLLSGAAVFLPALLFLAFPYHAVLDATHHWYSTAAVMAALATVVEKRTPARICVAGVFCGIATWYTQSVGPAVALALGLVLVWELRRRSGGWTLILKNEVALFGGYFCALAVLLSYFVSKAGAGQFVWCTFVFVLKYFSSDWFSNWHVYMAHRPAMHGLPNLMEWAGWLFIHALVPLVYLAAFIRHWREARPESSEQDMRIMLVAMVGFFSFLAVASAPSFRRLCTVSMPGIILFVCFIDSLEGLKRTVRRAALAASIGWIVAAPLLVQTHWHAFLDLPIGRTAFLNPNVYSEYQWIAERARPQDGLFGNQLMDFALGLRSPAPLDYVTASDYTRPEQVQGVIAAIERSQTRHILWYAGLPLDGDRKPSGDHLEPLRNYVDSHYQLANIFPNGDRIFEREK